MYRVKIKRRYLAVGGNGTQIETYLLNSPMNAIQIEKTIQAKLDKQFSSPSIIEEAKIGMEFNVINVEFIGDVVFEQLHSQELDKP